MEKILMIDDSKEILFALSQICELKKWESYTASNVYDGIDMFKKCEPDLVIIDYHMPVINGMVGVQLIRELSSEVPIIVMTVDENQSLADAFIEAGASDFALKPIKAPDLIARIRVHLRQKKSNVEASVEPLQYAKGISMPTLKIIETYMRANEDYLTLSGISSGTGLAYQTVHRYIQYLMEQGVVTLNQNYGKIGRPKQEYKWNGQ